MVAATDFQGGVMISDFVLYISGIAIVIFGIWFWFSRDEANLHYDALIAKGIVALGAVIMVLGIYPLFSFFILLFDVFLKTIVRLFF